MKNSIERFLETAFNMGTKVGDGYRLGLCLKARYPHNNTIDEAAAHAAKIKAEWVLQKPDLVKKLLSELEGACPICFADRGVDCDMSVHAPTVQDALRSLTADKRS